MQNSSKKDIGTGISMDMGILISGKARIEYDTFILPINDSYDGFVSFLENRGHFFD